MPKTQRKLGSIQNRKEERAFLKGKWREQTLEASIWPIRRRRGYLEVASVTGGGWFWKGSYGPCNGS